MDQGTRKVVLYARVSSKEQEEEGFSIPAQLKLLKEYAQKHGFDIVREFVDVETAKQAGRTNFTEMVRFLKDRPEVRAILCEKTDRLYRNIRDWVTIDDLGVEIHFVKEGEIVSKESRSAQKFMHGIRVLMAKNYVDNLSEEVIKGMTEKAEQGYFPSKAPIGYQNNGANHHIDLHPEGAGVVKQLFEWYATGHYSIKQVASKARQEGFRHPHLQRPLSPSQVEWILKNPIYYGEFRFRGKKYPGKHLPIVTRELFENVQQVMHRFNKPKYRKHEFLFAGLLTCGRCGCTITAEIKKGRYVYYHCTNWRGKCAQPWVKEEELDRRMVGIVKEVELTDEELGWLVKGLRKSHQDEKDYHDGQIAALNAQYAALQRRLDQIYLDKLDGKITEEFWREKHDAWRTEQQAILQQIEYHQKANVFYFEEGIKLLELSQQAHAMYVTKPPEGKRALLRFLLSNCTLLDVTPTPTYRTPFSWVLEARQNGDWLADLDSNQD